MSPVKPSDTGKRAVGANGDCVAAVVVVPVDNVESVPHVNVTVVCAPFEFTVPFMVAVVF